MLYNGNSELQELCKRATTMNNDHLIKKYSGVYRVQYVKKREKDTEADDIEAGENRLMVCTRMRVYRQTTDDYGRRQMMTNDG